MKEAQGLARFFEHGSKSGIQAQHAERLRLILGRLNVATAAQDMDLAGLLLQPLPIVMLYYALKIFLSALLIVAISEIAKRSTGFAALVAALPLTSLLAFVWLHLEDSPPERIAELSGQIFWLVLPSLVLFLLLPLLLRHGVSFWLSLGLSVAATAGCYLAALPLLRRMGLAAL